MTIEFRFTQAELDTIYEAMLRESLFAVTQPHPAYIPRCGRDPFTSHRFDVTAAGVSLRFAWDDEHCFDIRAGEWGRLYRVIGAIERVLTARAEYRRLPQAKGFYL